MYSKELLKGTLSVIVLKLLKDNDKMYGYEITQKVKELSENKIHIKEGSLYPALHKLKTEAYLTTETENIGNRVRKYYRLTEKGEVLLQEKLFEVKDFMKTIHLIISD
ncbi:MAG: PadR family transcriptional regulator [Bacteroidetes bacterium 4572_117]|nr:MAG: PadR family transcriptional regulator [Bacteroidetes bacterium 4572_117]